MILSVVTLLAAGCGSGADAGAPARFSSGADRGPRSSLVPSGGGAPAPREPETVRAAPREPEDPAAPPEAASPAATEVVASMLDRLSPEARRGPTCVTIAHVRNRSRSGAPEFDAMRHRLAAALTAAAPPEVVFTTGDAPPGALRLELFGTAYLVEAGGDEAWELFLHLRATDASWALWHDTRPLRMPRWSRPGAPSLARP
jgi:hypothetical protein